MKDYAYKLEMKTRDYECDVQGVVNHSNYIHYLEVTRLEFLQSIGIDLEQFHDRGIDIMVSNINISYKTSLRGRQEFISCMNVTRDGARYVYAQDIYRKSDMKLCASAEVHSIVVVNGSVSRGNEIEEIIKPYIQ